MKVIFVFLFVFVYVVVSIGKQINYNIVLNNDNFIDSIGYYSLIKLTSNDGKSCNRTLQYGICESNLCGGAALLIDGQENQKETGYTSHLGFKCGSYLSVSPFLCPISTFQYTIGSATYGFNVECYNDNSSNDNSQNSGSQNSDSQNSDSQNSTDSSDNEKFKKISLISNDGKSCNRTLEYGICESNLCGGAALLIDGQENQKETGYTSHLGFKCGSYLSVSPFLCPISTFQYTIGSVTYGFNVDCYN